MYFEPIVDLRSFKDSASLSDIDRVRKVWLVLLAAHEASALFEQLQRAARFTAVTAMSAADEEWALSIGVVVSRVTQ